MKTFLKSLLIILVLLPTLVQSAKGALSEEEKVHQYTRSYEFDFSSWTIDALLLKAKQVSVNLPLFLSKEKQKDIVFKYLDLVNQTYFLSEEIRFIYSDPAEKNPDQAASQKLAELSQLTTRRNQLGSITEAIVQQQINDILNELGLDFLGQSLPPVLYHTTPLPDALIISPRDVIRQDWDISLYPDLSIAEHVRIEQNVEENLNYSALVVPVGGIGTYPTMVANTSDIAWLIEVVSHEWTHNYLTLRPLGLNYYTNGELRTMNETAANIAGKEIAKAVLAEYYPEFLPEPATQIPAENSTPEPAPPAFDFRAEMHATRVMVDELLASGQIEQAEVYMEQRRLVFWDHGYQIRRLNQAYFAFYGAYADVPGGSAGEDPVGPAVTSLRENCATLAIFLQTISKMTSFDELLNSTQ